MPTILLNSTCYVIQIQSIMKYLWQLILVLVIFPNLTFAQLTYVPDDGFEQRLINLGLDSGPLDDYVQTAAIDTVTRLVVVPSDPQLDLVDNLDGIENFISLRYLKVLNSTFNFGQNINLDLHTLLNLDTLIIKHNSNMTNTIFEFNFSPNLKYIEFEGTGFSSLDFTSCIDLETIVINECLPAYSFDFSNSFNLKNLSISNGVFEYIDLSSCISLENLYLTSGGSGNGGHLKYINLKNGNNHSLAAGIDYWFYDNIETICVDSLNSQIAMNVNDHNYIFDDNINVTTRCATNKITGMVKYDLNDDNCSTSNFVLDNYLINSTDGFNSVNSTLSQNNYYSNYVFEGNYETAVLNLPSYLSASPTIEYSNFIADHNVDTINFCITPSQQINDVSVYFTLLSTSAPGFDGTGTLVLKNEGTTTLSGDVNLIYNDLYLSYLNSSETVTSQSNNELTFSYIDLQPFETKYIDVKFNILAPPITQIGDTLNFVAEITPLVNDYNDTNNVFIVNQIVNGSYDPNDISVMEGEEVLIEDSGEYLHYLIRFQNTGTAPAVNVNVITELDSNLNWNSLRLINSSHPTIMNMFNSELEFQFQNINLADSLNNEAESHGYIYYKIKPKNNVVVGDSISATADIYFDYNPPVITNTAVTLFIEESLGIIEASKNNLNIFPVPVIDILNVNSDNLIVSIEIYNQLGQLVDSNNNSQTINISTIESGFYICKITDNLGNTFAKTIVKE